MNIKFTLRTLIALFSIVLMSFIIIDGDDWEVPAEYESMTNPVTADEESLEIGKILYVQHCKSCHGKYGEGDGPKADDLETSCGDFTSDEFKAQSDGALFYKSYIGRDEMPNYEKKIRDKEDVWHIINYMKTL